MPRKLSYTKDAAFARTLAMPWTPWITAGWISPTTGQPFDVKYRIWLKRRGNGLYVQTHPESPYMPDQQRIVRTSHTRLYDLRRAGMQLLALVKWDDSRPPSHPRGIWNVKARDYGLRLELARTVSLAIPFLFEPRVGRPRVKPVTTDPHDPALPITLRGGGNVASRRRRRTDLLVMCERITNLITPIVEKLQDSRGFGGYRVPEQHQIRDMLTDVINATRRLHTHVYYDTLIQQPKASDAATVTKIDVEGLTMELVE